MDAIALLSLPPPNLTEAFLMGLVFGACVFGAAMFYIGWCEGKEKGLAKGIQVLRECTEQIFVWRQLPENTDRL